MFVVSSKKQNISIKWFARNFIVHVHQRTIMTLRNFDLRWTEVSLTVPELWQFYRDSLPLIVKATEGYDGILEEESHSKDDVSGFVFKGLKDSRRSNFLFLQNATNFRTRLFYVHGFAVITVT